MPIMPMSSCSRMWRLQPLMQRQTGASLLIGHCYSTGRPRAGAQQKELARGQRVPAGAGILAARTRSTRQNMGPEPLSFVLFFALWLCGYGMLARLYR